LKASKWAPPLAVVPQTAGSQGWRAPSAILCVGRCSKPCYSARRCDREPAALVATAPIGPTVEQRILAQLETAGAPLTATVLRKRCQVRNATLQTALVGLVADGRLRKDRVGYALAR
jgi:hypothetical protein